MLRHFTVNGHLTCSASMYHIQNHAKYNHQAKQDRKNTEYESMPLLVKVLITEPVWCYCISVLMYFFGVIAPDHAMYKYPLDDLLVVCSYV